MTDFSIGSRVAELRRRRGLTQEELHERSSVSLSVIKKIEQGTGGARMEAYTAIARALGVEMSMVVPRTSGAPGYTEPDDAREQMLTDMRKAIMPPFRWDGTVYRIKAVDERADLDGLRKAVRQLGSAYHATRYDIVGDIAPEVVRSAHFHVCAVPDHQRDDAIRLRCDALQVAGSYLTCIYEHDLALHALRDAIIDANALSDPILALGIVGNQARAMIRQGWFQETERLCTSAADEIVLNGATTPDALCAKGWLLLRASAVAARNNRPAEADEYLDSAAAIAERLGVEHQSPLYMHFGPLTVATKRTENAVLAAQPDRALGYVERLPMDVGATTPGGWHKHLLYRAQALIETRQHEKALEILDGLRVKSPQWLAHERHARDIMRELLRTRKRTYTDQQRDLADFLNLEM